MKAFQFEDIFPNNKRREESHVEISEDEAQEELEALLADPQNAFLTEVEQNRVQIEDALSSHEALAFAKSRIRARLEATLDARKISRGTSEHIHVNPDTILNTLEHIQKNAEEIGTGADGRVVIDRTDMREANPEICYKFSLLETIKRGRNSIVEEAELQSAFYEAAEQLPLKDIGIPAPYYEIDVFKTQMIAMEKLHARTADEILRGIGSLPPWFDVDRFCDSLRTFIDAMHKLGLYHRDMHFGNVMISQHATWKEGEPMGYIIDFGLSGYGSENMEPYKKEVAGDLFTYDDDYGRIQFLRTSLKALVERQKR